MLTLVAMLVLGLTSCGGGEATATTTPSGDAVAPAGGAAAGILEITSVAQFDAEITKSRPSTVVVADFHAEWCGPCKLLGPDLVAIAQANPGKLLVLKVDIDQHAKLAERFQVEGIPLLVKFADGKETARAVGYNGKDGVAAWLAIP